VLHRIALLLALLLLVAACGEDQTAPDDTAADTAPQEPADEGDEGDAEAADAQEAEPGAGLTAVTSVFPLADMAQEIAPAADVTLLTAGGQDPHDIELSPADRALIESADVVLYMGQIDFQPQLEAAVGDASGQTVGVAEVVGSENHRFYDGHSHDDDDHGHDDHGHSHDDDDHGHDDDDHGHSHDDDDHGHSHDDDHAHDDDDHGHDDDDHGHSHDDDDHGHSHDDDDHGHSHDDDDHGHDDHGEAVDPHLWFDAQIMADVAMEIGAAFAAADPDAEETYLSRAESLRDELLAIDDEIADLLTGCTYDTAIVSHQAYAYLLAPHRLDQVGISGAGGHGDASPQRLAELTSRIQDEDIPAVLAEPVEGRADAEALAAEAGVDLLEIDPLEIGTEELREMGYPDALRAQAETFAEALRCG
jgi:zinc transport system substrate-binding protein